MLSFTEENYIKAIYALTKGKPKGAATTKISEKLATKASSVTDMLRRLSEKGLIEHKKYQGATLTGLGKQTALSIVRKHRLWEVFLVKKLHFKWDEVHELAEQLEHIQSKELTNRLDKFLGFPTHDPHGDPIPNALGELPNNQRMELSACNVGEEVYIQGVKDNSSFLKYLESIQLHLGTKVKVMEKIEFDGSVQIELSDKTTHQLSKQACSSIYVETIT